MLKKIFGYGIAGVLTIGGVTTVVTQNDVEKQYQMNTGKDLVINENELVTFDEMVKTTREIQTVFQKAYDEMDCTNYEYDFHDSCYNVKTALKEHTDSYTALINCYNNIAKNDDLQKTDLTNCINAEKNGELTEKNLFNKMYGYCDEDCQSDVDAHEYNIALFQAYLNKVK